jgi:hypothetical protein
MGEVDLHKMHVDDQHATSCIGLPCCGARTGPMEIDEMAADVSHSNHPCHGVGKADLSRNLHHPATAVVQLGKEVTNMTDRRASKAPRVRDASGRKESPARNKDGRSRDKRNEADRRRK